MSHHQQDWDLHLPLVLLVYCSPMQESPDCTLAVLMFGRSTPQSTWCSAAPQSIVCPPCPDRSMGSTISAGESAGQLSWTVMEGPCTVLRCISDVVYELQLWREGVVILLTIRVAGVTTSTSPFLILCLLQGPHQFQSHHPVPARMRQLPDLDLPLQLPVGGDSSLPPPCWGMS
ncbi:hypothetical protein SKAU_G00163530 [Synaphobranchus kaupii]|uniref:Uncharacterized protein n=1 Tax=Synaphobranchus kaupii TaxID=118154 RepID=A0A9Q1FIZ8_SYNKA|nr:hypothetical protein SKAU_G00163530 [Synaphobranchus kaupii]